MGKNKGNRAPKKGGKGGGGSGGSKKTPGKYVVLLMGFPGSGKSTFCSKLSGSKYEVCSSDLLGTAGQKKMVNKTIKQGAKICVIDSCNCHPKDRKMWLTQHASDQQAIVIWFDAPADLCKQRVAARLGHPTLGPEQGDAVVDRFASGFKPPQDFETNKYALWIVESDEGDTLAKLTEFVNK